MGVASPTPDPSRPHSRYRRTHNVVVLPAEGCSLPPPRMPKGREWTAAQRALWRELWRSPQAVMWDDSYTSTVAMYVSHVSAVLEGTASAWQAQEARHLSDRLGLSPAGMLACGWRLPDPGEDTAQAPVPLRAVR